MIQPIEGALAALGALSRGAPAQQAGAPAPTDGTAPATPSAAPEAPALNAAMLAAAVKQSGLAQLLADLTQALDLGIPPAPVQQAAERVIARALPSERPPAPAEIREALTGSGLFLESSLAAGRTAPDLKADLLSLRQTLQAWVDETPDEPPASSPAPSPLSAGSAAVAPSTPDPRAPRASLPAGPAPQTAAAAPTAGPTAPPPSSSLPATTEPPEPTPGAQAAAALATGDRLPADTRPAPSVSTTPATPQPPEAARVMARAAPSLGEQAPVAGVPAPPAWPRTSPTAPAPPAAASNSPPLPAPALASAPPQAAPPVAAPQATPQAPAPAATDQQTAPTVVSATAASTPAAPELTTRAGAPSPPPASAMAAPPPEAAPASIAPSQPSPPPLAAAPPMAEAQTPGSATATTAASASQTAPAAPATDPRRVASAPTTLAAPRPPAPEPALRPPAAPILPQLLDEPVELAAGAQAYAEAGYASQRASPRGQAPALAAGAIPPPPIRGAPTSAQRAARPSLPLGASTQAIARRLLQETQGALAREELMQIASIPEGDAGPSWMFELPFLTPQGPAVAQFQVSRDPSEQERQGEDAAPTWRARFSVDMEPVGPVHATVALAAGKATVMLWAEREASAEVLKQEEAQLSSALKGAGLDPEIAVLAGAPRRPTPAPGRLVDQSS